MTTLGYDADNLTQTVPNHVFLESMGIGPSVCCLQVTVQASCIDEARMLYDQLATVCPIMVSYIQSHKRRVVTLCENEKF